LFFLTKKRIALVQFNIRVLPEEALPEAETLVVGAALSCLTLASLRKGSIVNFLGGLK
jgi:hypothetical protein